MIWISMLIFIASCDSIQTQFSEKLCYQLGNSGDKYLVEKREGLKIYMKNLKTGASKKISGMDRGWGEVECYE